MIAVVSEMLYFHRFKRANSGGKTVRYLDFTYNSREMAFRAAVTGWGGV